MSKPVGVATGLLAGTVFAAVLLGDGLATGVSRGLFMGVVGFAVAFWLESRKADGGE